MVTCQQPFTSTIANGENGVLSGIYAIFFAEIVTSTIIQLLDISGNFKRHYFAPRQKTQEDMNQCMSGAGIELAERYTVSNKFSSLMHHNYQPLLTISFPEYDQATIFSTMVLSHLSRRIVSLLVFPVCELLFR